MKKILFTLLVYLISINIYSQNNYDVRKVKWGMTEQEIMNSEYPLEPSKKETNIIEYENVFIGEGYLSKGFNAKLIYKFKNKRLIGLKYIANLIDKPKTVTFSLTQKVSMSEYVFDAMKSKNYECSLGWHMNAMTPKECLEEFGSLKICSLDFEFVEKIEKIAKDRNEINIYVTFENERSQASFCFYEFQNSESESVKKWALEGSLFYTLEIEPNYEFKKEMNKSRF